jgi:hypothetical protein
MAAALMPDHSATLTTSLLASVANGDITMGTKAHATALSAMIHNAPTPSSRGPALDSGSGAHLTTNRTKLTNRRRAPFTRIQGFDGSTTTIQDYGDVGLLKGVTVTDTRRDLISTGLLLDGTNYKIIHDDQAAYLARGINILGHTISLGHDAQLTKIAWRDNDTGLYIMRPIKPPPPGTPAEHDIYDYFRFQNAKAATYTNHRHPDSICHGTTNRSDIPVRPNYHNASCYHCHAVTTARDATADPAISTQWACHTPLLPQEPIFKRPPRDHLSDPYHCLFCPHRVPHNTTAPPPANTVTTTDHDGIAGINVSKEMAITKLKHWHRSLGHPGMATLNRALKRSGNKQLRILASKVGLLPKCVDCMIGAAQQQPHNKKSTSPKATKFLERLHVDCSTDHDVDCASMSGKRFFMAITDEWSGYRWIFFAKAIPECVKIFSRFLHVQCRQNTLHPVRFCRTDGGPEFSTLFHSTLENAQIIHERPPADSSESNGVAESTVGHIAKKTRILLSWADLPPTFWAEAAQHAVHMMNITPSSRPQNGGASPYRMRTGREHRMDMLAPFGCLATVYIKPQHRGGKMKPAAHVGIFLGHGERSDGGVIGYRVYKHATNTIVIKHDVELNTELPAMQFIASSACTAVDSQFLNRTVTKTIDGRRSRGTVHSSRKGSDGATRWVVAFPIKDNKRHWEEVDFHHLLQLLQPDPLRASETLPERIRPTNQPKPIGCEPLDTPPHHPVDYTGRTIKKLFGTKWFLGTVTGKCTESDGPDVWRVHYPADDTWEPLPLYQITKLLVKDPADDHDTTSDHPHKTPTPRRSGRKRTQTKAYSPHESDTDHDQYPTTADDHDYSLSHTRRAKSAIAFSIIKLPTPDENPALPPKRAVIKGKTLARSIPEPRTTRQARSSAYRDYFMQAELKETESLISKGVWTIEHPDHPVTVVKGAFVYKVKELPGGFIDKFKARYCAKGYSQIKGLHYKTAFSPVASAAAVKTVMYLACENSWELHHLDVSVAFLNADLEPDVELYIQPPPTVQLKPGEHLRLRKGLYGLVQGSARWNLLLTDTLKRLGFRNCRSDACVFIRKDHRGTVITSVVVDDFCITGDDPETIAEFKTQLKALWACTDCDTLDWFLKLKVDRHLASGRMSISQKTYIQGMVARYLTGTKTRPVDTPADARVTLSNEMSPKTDSDRQAMKGVQYRELLGSLQYTRLTRPDILLAISIVAKYQNNPGLQHYQAALRILSYLANTPDHRIVWTSTGRSPTDPWDIECFCDADWANDPDHRRSRSGYLITFNGNVIDYGSGLQPKTASSTPVAEYVALASAVKQIVWLKQLLQELNIKVVLPIPVREDNTTCIHIASNPAAPKRTRHMDIRYHFIRDYVTDQIIKVSYVKSKDQLADIFTKALPRPAFRKLRHFLVSDSELKPD